MGSMLQWMTSTHQSSSLRFAVPSFDHINHTLFSHAFFLTPPFFSPLFFCGGWVKRRIIGNQPNQPLGLDLLLLQGFVRLDEAGPALGGSSSWGPRHPSKNHHQEKHFDKNHLQNKRCLKSSCANFWLMKWTPFFCISEKRGLKKNSPGTSALTFRLLFFASSLQSTSDCGTSWVEVMGTPRYEGFVAGQIPPGSLT